MINQKLATLVSFCSGSSAIDIGTDHGYLLIELYKKKFTKLLGIDVNKKPLENCLKNLEKANIASNVRLVLSDGLNQLSDDEVFQYENIIIAGMGGDLILKIILKDKNKFKKSKLILQPNNNEYQLRKKLQEEHFEILDEKIIKDKNKFYEIIIFKYNNSNNNLYSEEELYFGKFSNENLEFKEKWEKEYENLLKLIDKIIEKNKKIPFHLEEKEQRIKKKLKI